jgi:hypothetical protein
MSQDSGETVPYFSHAKLVSKGTEYIQIEPEQGFCGGAYHRRRLRD